VVQYFGYSLVTASSGTYTFTQIMQQVVLRQRHRVVVNTSATQRLPAGTVTQPTCATATGSFRLQVIAHPPILSHQV
jgi:hypothetical protein